MTRLALKRSPISKRFDAPSSSVGMTFHRLSSAFCPLSGPCFGSLIGFFVEANGWHGYTVFPLFPSLLHMEITGSGLCAFTFSSVSRAIRSCLCFQRPMAPPFSKGMPVRCVPRDKTVFFHNRNSSSSRQISGISFKITSYAQLVRSLVQAMVFVADPKQRCSSTNQYVRGRRFG